MNAWTFNLDGFAENLRQSRQALGLSQRDLAGRLDMQRSAVANWEQGVTTPSIETLCRVCAEVGLDPRRFFAQR